LYLIEYLERRFLMSRLRTTFIVSAALIGVAVVLAASSSAIAVGDSVPDFSLVAAGGEEYGPQRARGEKPLVLIFFRGTW
jgi:hypothetical protein